MIELLILGILLALVIIILHLRASEQRKIAILSASLDPIVILEDQKIQFVSDSITSIFQWTPQELIDKDIHVLLAKSFVFEGKKNIKKEIIAKRKDNSTFPCEISVTAITNANKQTVLFSIIFRDINEHKQYENKLIWLSTHDELTKIFNRRYFNQQIEFEWRRLIRSELYLALIMLDIDFFKNYNDTLGHQAGDICLQQIAAVISKALKRVSDFVARYGGEEFVILMPNTNIDGAVAVAKKIQDGIKNLNIPHPISEICGIVTVSMGVSSMIPTKACSSEVLIRQADYSLYKAKEAGKNCYKIYEEVKPN